MGTSGVDKPFCGFWRRFRIDADASSVTTQLEDDYHCMAVRIEHRDGLAHTVHADLRRAPWTTCPGAAEQLRLTFEGAALTAFAGRGEKKRNCTHLHDLAVLGAAHAHDAAPSEIDALIEDPVDGVRQARLQVNGNEVLSWREARMTIVEPEPLAGLGLFELSDWIAAQPAQQAEWARLLRWANVIANGRQIPLHQQSDASKMPANCFSFQPARAAVAARIGRIRDFSQGLAQPLDGG